ncbi:MBL fold metallo-hydrolase [Patescibacteria group bacterium]|nr:MBL fold metallo-hydrolase [Patescibacteria group bacterium]
MTEVKILIEGHVKKLKDGWIASPSTVLIRDRGLNIIVDPGSDKELLLKKLTEEGLKPDDIDIIFLTHHHLDHTLNIRIFPDCDILLDGDKMNEADRIFSYSENIPGTDIRVIPTLGHTFDHASLLAETEKGKIVIAGDLFWWLDKEEQKTDYKSLMDHKDPGGAKDEKALQESRKKILEIADYIIPGHGKMFKIEK